MVKYLAVAIILLFIGFAVAPSINANISKGALVEFTTEICGLKGGKQTVKLTQEEADEVERLFDSIREQLDATETREEAEEIFKEAVVELDKYGLLGGLSVKQAQRLVTDGYQYSRFIKLSEYTSDRYKGIFGNNTNSLCLIIGHTDNKTYFIPPIPGVYRMSLNLCLMPLVILIFSMMIPEPSGVILFALTRWLLPLFILLFPLLPIYSIAISYANHLKPLFIGTTILFGEEKEDVSIPADGSVFTIGLNGIKRFESPLFGQMIQPGFLPIYPESWRGVIGFTGIKLYSSGNYLFLGSALHIKLGSVPPEG